MASRSKSFDYISIAAQSVIDRIFPETTGRQRRIQELLIEIEDMEKTLSVLEFGVYFNKVVEMKDLLLEELVAVCTKIRKQDVEVERLTVVLNEKNKAISTLANENEAEKEEFKAAQIELKELRKKVARMEEQEERYKSIMSKLKKSDSAREQFFRDNKIR